ncbi:MAG TPA: serine--tRNA ligase [Planctomycetia bacterium]|nr:serine--tRNA ligase [Planctomycetia bacterium]
MLDLKFIRANPQIVKDNCAARRVPADVDKLVAAADKRHALGIELQDVQRQQNEVAKLVKSAADKAARDGHIAEGKRLKERAAEIEQEVRSLDEEIHAVQAFIPNLTHPSAPATEDAVLRTWGDPQPKPYKALDHYDLCLKHGLADFEAAARVTGSDFYYLTGQGALLELALIQYALGKLVPLGFTPVLTPDLARTQIMEGTGYIPRGAETQIYSIAGGDLCLIATSEITLAGMFAEQTIEGDKLPLKFVGVSHCFRTESGAAGRATRGLYRVHQFTKVEMFAFCRPEESDALHEEFRQLEEEIFQGLEIPYRVLDIAAADLGGPAYRKYDLEAWMPGRGEAGEFGEVTSTSNCTDYQARRLNVRFKDAGQKGTQHVHMLNGTAVATGRAILALLENHQREDGSVAIPKALQPWMFGKNVIGS